MYGIYTDDPLFKGQAHRSFFTQQVHFHSVIDFKDPSLQSKIHFHYRLSYVKDSVLGHILDERALMLL